MTEGFEKETGYSISYEGNGYYNGKVNITEAEYYKELAEWQGKNNKDMWTVEEIIEELKDIDAFDSAKYFHEKFNT